MGETFIITINFSKVLMHEKQTIYTMLVDNSEMTIVYELTEWIRWIFSLKGCCYLTHQNSVIHELEDIKILSLLKNLEMNMCNSLQCIHQKTHKILLDSLNFFTYWNGVQVPRLFLEKISKIQQKFDEKNVSNTSLNQVFSSSVQYSLNFRSKNMEPKSQPNNKPMDSQLSCLKLPINPENNTDSMRNNSDVLFYNESCKSENEVREFNVTGKRSSDFKSNEDVKILSSNINSPKIHVGNKLAGEISKKNLEDVEDSCLLSASAERIKSDGKEDFAINSGSKKKFNGRKRIKNYIKPFTLGDVLKNLRDELKEMKDTTEVEQTVKENHSPVINGTGLKETQLINQDLPGFFDDFTNLKGKKRKRIRKHKSKKLKSAELNIGLVTCPMPSENIAVNNSSNVSWEGKSNHIRFTSDDENYDNEVTENTEKKDYIFNDPLIRNAFKKIDFSKNFQPEVKDERQILSDAGLGLVSEGVSTKMECESVGNNLVNVSENQIVLDPENCNSATQCDLVFQNLEHNVHELSALMSLKEKYSGPVIIERFS